MHMLSQRSGRDTRGERPYTEQPENGPAPERPRRNEPRAMPDPGLVDDRMAQLLRHGVMACAFFIFCNAAT